MRQTRARGLRVGDATLHIKTIGGRSYVYESVRRGGKSTSRCWGRIDSAVIADARAFAEDCRLDREMTRAADARAEALRMAPILELRRSVSEFGREVDEAVSMALESLGYHRGKRGPWRKRRGWNVGEATKVRLSRTPIGELIYLANKGDALAAEKLPAALVAAASRSGGDVETETISFMLDVLPTPKEAAEARVELMRRELAPPGSSPIVRLMASRVVADWVMVQVWEKYLAGAWSGKFKSTVGQVERWEKSLNSAILRYQRGLVALARIRRLTLPVLVGQINVAAPGSQQVNQACLERPAEN